MSVTFAVHNVVSKPPLKHSLYSDIFTTKDGWEASGSSSLYLVSKAGFLRTLSTSCNRHYPLTLTPDSVWLTLLQEFIEYVDNNPGYRSKLGVNFGVKKDLIVINNRKPELIKEEDVDYESRAPITEKQINWVENLKRFTEKIKKDVEDSKYSLFMNPFSTSGEIETTAMAVSMMSSERTYFRYQEPLYCGIPFITLGGERKDWIDLLHRVSIFSEFGLEWWVRPLLGILQRFVWAFDGFRRKIDKSFWENIYSNLLSFFPYLNSGRCPDNIIKVPFLWEHFGNAYKMEFLTGIIGTSQKENFAVRPEIGWGVREIIPT